MIDKRKWEESFFKMLMIGSTIIILLSLCSIVVTIVLKGLPVINLAMLTQTPERGFYLGKGGGVLNAILGSLILAGGATLIALFISLPLVLYVNIFMRKGSRLASCLRLVFDVLWGVPSIIYGAFAFIIMLFLGMHVSLLSGIIAIALLEIPIMMRAMDEAVLLVPIELEEAAYSLGVTELELAFKVIIKQIFPGIITAILIAFGRGIGDTAIVLFTTGFSDSLPSSLADHSTSLPLAIFFQMATPIPEVQNRAYASAFILMVIVLLISIITRLVSSRYTKHVIK